MNWIWIVSLIVWAMIVALSLVMLSLMRQVGNLANYLDGVKEPHVIDESADAANAGPLIASSAMTAPRQEEEVESFAPFSELPDFAVALAGGIFRCGGGQKAPQLIVFFSPKSGACEQLPEAIKDFVKNNSPVELAFLAVLDLDHSAAKKYITEKLLESVPIAVLQDVPKPLRPGEVPFAIAIAADGRIAARGKPKTLVHLTEMAVAARHMAGMCPDHSRRTHEWGESAPYWAFGHHVAHLPGTQEHSSTFGHSG
jgi:hypothetical protein